MGLLVLKCSCCFAVFFFFFWFPTVCFMDSSFSPCCSCVHKSFVLLTFVRGLCLITPTWSLSFVLLVSLEPRKKKRKKRGMMAYISYCWTRKNYSFPFLAYSVAFPDLLASSCLPVVQKCDTLDIPCLLLIESVVSVYTSRMSCSLHLLLNFPDFSIDASSWVLKTSSIYGAQVLEFLFDQYSEMDTNAASHQRGQLLQNMDTRIWIHAGSHV